MNSGEIQRESLHVILHITPAFNCAPLEIPTNHESHRSTRVVTQMQLWTLMLLALVLVTPSICSSEELEYDYRDSAEYHELSPADRAKLERVVKDLRSLETAIGKHMLDHDGDAPKTLDALLPDYVSVLPEDPFAKPDATPKKLNEHYQLSLRGRGFLYKRRAGPSIVKSWKPLTFYPSEDAWEIKSVGLENFPLRFRSSNGRGLIRGAGYWGRLMLDVF